MTRHVARRPRVLIVEDEQPLRELLVVTLGAGFDCDEAADGESALVRMHEQPPDLVLLDSMLPGRSGREVLEEMRSDPALAQVPVVVISAWQQKEDVDAALSAGADRFLGKPFRIEELTALANELVGTPP
jgi:DNA-binding response OmpR family regulator